MIDNHEGPIRPCIRKGLQTGSSQTSKVVECEQEQSSNIAVMHLAVTPGRKADSTEGAELQHGKCAYGDIH